MSNLVLTSIKEDVLLHGDNLRLAAMAGVQVMKHRSQLHE